MDSSAPVASARERLAGALVVLAVLALLAVVSNRAGSFFDDEIYTIGLLEPCRSWRDVIAAANGGDVHPPLGYLIDFGLWRLLGEWKAVQLVAGLANAAALAAVAWIAAPALPRRTWLILVALLATAASVVMWGASLRWYAWFNPVFALALAAYNAGAPAEPRTDPALAEVDRAQRPQRGAALGARREVGEVLCLPREDARLSDHDGPPDVGHDDVQRVLGSARADQASPSQ